MPRGRRDDTPDEKRKDQRDAKRDDAPANDPPVVVFAESADQPRPAARTPDAQPSTGEDAETQALSAFFRELATRAERDPTFGAGLLSIAQASGLARLTGDEASETATDTTPAHPTATPTAANAHGAPTPASATARRPRKRVGASAPAASPTAEPAQPAPDPFAVMRAQGEAGLRATLDALDLPTLRQIVRAHRLDPARISARWANRDRVIALIVDQTRARLNHGRAFERV